MIIGKRLKNMREEKKLSQGDVTRMTGISRYYISRVEHGRAVPKVSTLEKFAYALQVPLYQLFYLGKLPPKSLIISGIKSADDPPRGVGSSRVDLQACKLEYSIVSPK